MYVPFPRFELRGEHELTFVFPFAAFPVSFNPLNMLSITVLTQILFAAVLDSTRRKKGAFSFLPLRSLPLPC